jgi:DNA-binding HxlR family transcriptional regulator
MSKRTYNQYCGLAAALDMLGERWTLLIIRELLVGPRRYGELLNDLPGIGTNLLAERLQFLVNKGIVRQTDLGGTSSRQAYELTESGEALRAPVLGLARWGLDFVGDLSAESTVRPHWGFLAVQAMINPDKVPDIDEQYEFHVDDEIFHIDVRGGTARASSGPAQDPAMTVTTDATTFILIGAGRLRPLTAMLTGQLALQGDIEAMLRCSDLLGLETPARGMPFTASAATG